MMFCGRTRTAWIGALLALYMVVLFPAALFGRMIEAVELGLPAPTNSNNNEEREEHEPAEVTVRDAQGVRPPLPDPELLARPIEVRFDAPPPRLLASVTHVPEPAVLSVRRLL